MRPRAPRGAPEITSRKQPRVSGRSCTMTCAGMTARRGCAGVLVLPARRRPCNGLAHRRLSRPPRPQAAAPGCGLGRARRRLRSLSGRSGRFFGSTSTATSTPMQRSLGTARPVDRRAATISVLEHSQPARGPKTAVQELVRGLKPGGCPSRAFDVLQRELPGSEGAERVFRPDVSASRRVRPAPVEACLRRPREAPREGPVLIRQVPFRLQLLQPGSGAK